MINAEMADRDINTLVAKRVMGWVWNCGGWSSHDPASGITTDYCEADDSWSPGTNLPDAWRVIEKLRELGFSVSVNVNPASREWLTPQEGVHPREWKLEPRPNECYQVAVFERDVNSDAWFCKAQHQCDSVPRAVCLVALRAVGAL